MNKIEIPKQSFIQWLWEYFSLNKKHREIARATRKAEKLLKAYNKRFYVFYMSDGRCHVFSRHQIEIAKNKGIFKKGMNINDILKSAVYVTR